MARSARSQQNPSLTVQVYWDERHKGWTVTARTPSTIYTTLPTDSTVDMDMVMAREVAIAVARAIESILPF